MSDVYDCLRGADSTRDFLLATSPTGTKLHLVPRDRLTAADKYEAVKSECSRDSAWTAVENQTRTDHSPPTLCRNCFRAGLSRGHLDSPHPFSTEDLGL